MRHIIPISGKDSLCTALVQVARFPQLPYEFIYNDTGCELPETYQWLTEVEQKTGWSIQRIGLDLEAQIHHRGGFLPGPRSRYCTSEGKIGPFEEWLGRDEAIAYYGLRADEDRVGYVPIRKARITPAYPLRDLGIDLQGVYAILVAQGLLPPSFHWQRLEDAVSSRLEQIEGWRELLPFWLKRSLFSGRTRANCYFCFFQKQVELVWLMETHPDLFWRMASFEKSVEQQPKATRPKAIAQTSLFTMESAPEAKAYTWMADFSLQEIADRPGWRDQIFEKHASKVAATILEFISQKRLGLTLDTAIAQTSCGLICGK